MKWSRGTSLFVQTVLVFSFLFASSKLFAVNSSERLYIPGLEPASQSNLVVTVLSRLSKGDPCPMKYTNILSNTNLFTPEAQMTIAEVLGKYKKVTTNSGPSGSVLVNCYKTNLITPPLYWVAKNSDLMTYRTNEIWVSCFQYANLDAQEEIRFGAGLSARFTNKSNDGYTFSIVQTGSGSLLTFSEKKHGSATGLLVRFADLHAQGITWDRKLADFSDSHLEEYMQTTNGMMLGKWLVWDPSSGGLIWAAECKEPYDWNMHRMKMRQ